MVSFVSQHQHKISTVREAVRAKKQHVTLLEIIIGYTNYMTQKQSKAGDKQCKAQLSLNADTQGG